MRYHLVRLFFVAVVPAAMGFVAMPSLAGYQRSPLETMETYCDERGFGKHDGSNQVFDDRTGRIQAVGLISEGPYPGKPEEAARAFLFARQDWLGLEPSEENLRVERIVESPIGYHVTFVRVIHGVEVYPGTCVVSLDFENRVFFYFSGLALFDDPVSSAVSISSLDAEEIAIRYLNATGKLTCQPWTDLVIWAGDNREFAPCWKHRTSYEDPLGDWEVLVDARDGNVRRCINRMAMINGTGNVFMPDPCSSSGQPYGSAGYVDNSDSDSPQLTAQLISVTLRDITLSGFPPMYRLTGPWCTISEIEFPTLAPAASTTTTFAYTRSHPNFEDVMCYYHVDAVQRYLQSLGFNNIQNLSMPVDAHGLNGQSFAYYNSAGNYIIFGEGLSDSCVDIGEDGEIIWHEYGHAIHADQIPGWGGAGDEDALGEGFSDYWGGSYGRTLTPFFHTQILNWGAHPCAGTADLLPNLHYPEDANDPDPHWSGRIWTQPLYEAEVATNRTAINRSVIQSHFLYGSPMSMPAAALALLSAELSLYQGGYAHAISDACVARGLLNRPSNDTCPGTFIGSLPFSQTTTTSIADNNYVNCAGATSPDIVYTLRLSCPHLVTVDLCSAHPNGSYDTGVEIRTGGSCPGTTQVVCNDDACGVNGRQSSAQFIAAASTDYYIIVHGYSTYAGPVVVNVSGQPFVLPPQNDVCPGTFITSVPFTDFGSTCSASNDYSGCVGSTSADVVYTLELSSCQTITVSLCGANYDTGLQVKTSGSCPGSLLVACNDDFCGVSSQVQFAATAYQPYYILVHGFSATSRGNFTIDVTGTPYYAGNDSCPGTLIASLPYYDFGNTYCSESDWTKCVGPSSRDVVYRFASQSCQTISASLCGSSYDTALEVRRRGSCPGADLVACNDDYCELQSFVTFTATESEYYYFIVHGFSASAGGYLLQVSSTPGGVQPNDVCAGATLISALPYQDNGSTVCATNNRVNCVGASSPEVFYRMNLESCTDVVARLCYSSFDTGLEVRTGGGCPGSTLVGCNDDNLGCNPEGSLQSIVQFRAQPSTDYFLIVHGYATNAGPYVLDIVGSTCAPESLVVQRQGNNAYLDWAPVISTGAVTYRLYRSVTPDVLTLPGNLIATTTNAFYADMNVISGAEKYFYAVTADGPTLALAQPSEHAGALQLDAEKLISKEQLDEMRGRVIPAYVDSANIGGANPDKARLVGSL